VITNYTSESLSRGQVHFEIIINLSSHNFSLFMCYVIIQPGPWPYPAKPQYLFCPLKHTESVLFVIALTMDVIMGYFGISNVLSSTYVASSLNLLFFYLTWATLIMTQPPLRIELLGSFAMRILFYWIPTILFTAFEGLMPGLSSDLKIRSGPSVGGKDKFWIALNGLMNQVIATVIQGLIQFSYSKLLMQKSSVFDIGTTLPLPWNIATDILLLLSVREVITYTLHRFILHNTRRYKQLSRLHSFHHRFPKSPTFALKAHYAHPIDYFLLQFLPLYLPAYLRRVHLLTFFVTLAIVSLESALIYSGYDIFWGLLGGTVRRIDRHHCPGGEHKDFGIWGILDWVSGTAGGRSRPEEEGGAINVNKEVSKEVNKQKNIWEKKLKRSVKR
jgi:Fatty acid hydroxylase superfamily